MPRNQQFDSVEFTQLNFAYNRILGELDETPRLTAGLNSYVTFGAKIVKRAGTLKISDALLFADGYPDRLWIYETLDNPPRVYLMGSFKTGDTWEMFYCRLDATPAPTEWTSLGTLRNLDQSAFPHEGLSKRGFFYIKGFPVIDRIGTVIFDGSETGDASTTIWGLLGPQDAASLSSPGSWPASDHAVTVNIGWKYVYAYGTKDLQISNQSPLQTNPDKDPSVTGAFTNKIPQVTITGVADTVNIPTINIYRTTDGGGTFYFLHQIDNPGATTVIFEDKYLESGVSGGVFNDPIPDDALDTTQVAPTLTSNSPPPACVAPAVTGVDAIQRSTPLCEYAGRIWYAIGEYLFFSALEEINGGVGEDSWPSGERGNFFRFQYPVMNLTSSADALYVHTLQATYQVSGTNRETFNPRPYLASIGAPYGHPRARTIIGDTAVWLTHDFRIATIGPSGFSVISDPLFTDITDAVVGGAEIELGYWAELDKEFLIVCAHRPDATLNSRQWVYDLKKSRALGGDFWNTPWSIRTTAMASGRIDEQVSNRRLVFGVYDGTNSTLVRQDPTVRTGTDYQPDGTTPGFTVWFNTHLITIPPGNHFNNLRKPAASPAAHAILMERSVFPGDGDPQVYFYRDDFWTDPIHTLNPNPPWRRPQSKAYRALSYNVNKAGKRFAVKIQKVNTRELFEMHSLALVWNPEGGA